MLDKLQVAKILNEIGLLLQIKGESSFKTRAYETAALRLADISAEQFEELVKAKRLTELPGIGDSMSAKILSLCETGKLAYYDDLCKEVPPGLLELTKIPDLGPKRVAQLYKELQIGSIEELEKACKEGRLRKLKGFGPKSETKILDGIALVKKLGERRPIGVARPVADALAERLRKVSGVTRVEVGGSVRRYRDTVADVDIVVAAPQADPVFDALVGAPLVERVLGRGDTKCSILLDDGLQVDCRVLPDEKFATALHHFTGSKNHHIKLRGIAHARGLKVSEWGVERTTDGSTVPIATEEDLYKLLELPYIPPELREDTGEIEAAQQGKLPELLEWHDPQGFVHVHTKASDGADTVLELAQAVKARGGKYLTITDHSRSAGYAGGLDIDRLKAQWDEIAKVQELIPEVKLFRGSEVDILEDGSLDYPDDILEQLDIVIGSVHSYLKMSETDMTKRILKAMSNPHLQVLGHPTGRLLGKREAYPVRMEEILEKAAELKVAVEINGTPDRLDLCAEHVRYGRDHGVKLVVTTDAHSIPGLDFVPLAIATARRGWARKSDVLNCLPADRFLGSLR